MGNAPNTGPLDWQWPCWAVLKCTRRKLLIRCVCFFQPFLIAGGGGGWGMGGGGRPGLVMNVLTSMCFKSTVYPWGMEQLEHGLRGNCLFHWPAAKGEEVNGKRYESVCPLRWWIRFKLEEEAFQSAALWLFHSYHLKLFSVFCSAAHSGCPHFFLIFLSPVLPFFLPLPPCCSAAGFWGCVGWQVELSEVKRARAAFTDCETESWDSMAFS